MCFDFDISFNLDNQLNIGNKPTLDNNTIYDLLIIGGGPASLNAALYSKRKGVNVGIIAKDIGGQVADTSSVENYLGYPSITGEGLIQKFKDHVNELSIPILKHATVSSIKIVPNSSIKELVLSNGDSYKAKSLIIATGSKPKQLGVPGELEFLGKGVAYCAICDGPLFIDKEIIVAGGGNSAVEAAIDLSKIGNQVTLIHRSDLKADKILINQLLQLTNVNILLHTQIEEILGDKFVTGVKVLEKKTQSTSIIPAHGVFVEIGYLPNSDYLKELLLLNEKGEIVVDLYGKTNVEGIFAAGDVTNIPYKQIIISAADGAKCALSANEYLNVLKIKKEY